MVRIYSSPCSYRHERSLTSPLAALYASRSSIFRIVTSDHVRVAIKFVKPLSLPLACAMLLSTHPHCCPHRWNDLSLTLPLHQVCQFCFNNIKNNMNGLCPACRRHYDEKTIEWKVVSPEE